MREIVLVDSQPARVRMFREAVALCEDVPLTRRASEMRKQAFILRQRSFQSRVRAREQIDRSRRAHVAMRVDQEMMASANGGPAVDEIRLHVFPCGDEALRFLRREEPYGAALRPAVVFTDLFLDGGGAAFVEQLKADPTLQAIPTVMLSSGATQSELREAWEAGCNAVVDLPPGDMAFRQVSATLRFWLSEVVSTG